MRITNQRKIRKTKKSHKKVILKWIILLVLLGMALYFYRNSLQEILEGIQALSVRQLLISCLIAMVFFLTEGYIVYYMAHPIEASYSWTKGIRVAYLCEFYRILTLGSGSGFAAIYYLQKDGSAMKGSTDSDYTCQGKQEGETEIAGKKVESWTEGKKVTYTVTAKDDGWEVAIGISGGTTNGG